MAAFILVISPVTDDPMMIAPRARLEGSGWRLRGLGDRALLATLGARSWPARILPDAGGYILGDTFEQDGRPSRPRLVGASNGAKAAALVKAHWGSYVGVLARADGEVDVLREPAGSVECAVWRVRGRIIVASRFPPELGELLPALSIDWGGVERRLADGWSARPAPLLAGARVVFPGELALADGGSNWPWNPRSFVGDGAGRRAHDAARMRCALDRVTKGLGRARGGHAVLLSGGLDSSVVAGRAAAGKQVRLIHFTSDSKAAREEAFAKAQADHLGLPLDVLRRPTDPIAPPREDELDTFEPDLTLFAPQYLDVLRDHCERHAITDLWTGRGGDMVFLQSGVSIAPDLLRRDGLRALFSRELYAFCVARHENLWRQWRIAFAGETRPGEPLDWVLGRTRRPMRDRSLSPAKAIHLSMMATGPRSWDRSSARAFVTYRNPLLAQPMIEACLAASTPNLCGGGRDRALARDAFKDVLAPLVLHRRSKASLSPHHGRRMLDGLDFIRPFLLEGVLVGRGLLDRERLARALEPHALAWRCEHAPLLDALALEAWVRHWSARSVG